MERLDPDGCIPGVLMERLDPDGCIPGVLMPRAASVSAQAGRITRLVSDLRKLADLETQEIEAAPVGLPGQGLPSRASRVTRVTRSAAVGSYDATA